MLVAVSIIVLLMWILYPRLYVYRTDVRSARAQAELASFRLVVEAFAAGPGNGHYPRASNDPADPASVAAVLRERGVGWGGPGGVRDPWGNPYRYYTAPLAPVPLYPLSYAFASAGADGVFGTADDVWATDWDPPTVGDPSGRWFTSGGYPCAESASVLQVGGNQ
jgi:general secretion pathway protein G